MNSVELLLRMVFMRIIQMKKMIALRSMSGDGRNDLPGQTANSEATVDTTTPQTMTATATWRDADSNNRLVVKQFLITKTY